MLKQDLAGFIQGNQVIPLQSAEGGHCNNKQSKPNLVAKILATKFGFDCLLLQC